jgi:aminopeptidase N
MLRIVFFLAVVFVSFTSSAQLLDGRMTEFTLADTLRGALRPERTCFDVNYYHLNLDILADEKSISGYNEIYYTTIDDFKRLQIDLFDNMQIDSIVYHGKKLSYERIYNAVFVDFENVQKKGTQDYFTVYYHGTPIEAKMPPWDGGFVWKKDKDGNPWIGVSCEGIGASLWWPNKDHLSDEPDSMRVTCRVPNDLIFVGNGQLESATIGNNGKPSEYTWKVTYPINNYNVTVNIAKYANFQDFYLAEDGDTLLLDYWVLPYNLEKAKKHFEQVKPMLACYEQYFGKFPFWNDNYKLVETPYLGMEHQTAIAYGNQYKTGYLGKDYSRIGLDFDYIIIHETGHEYWGNLVSAKDMADMWIHESFCTYSEALYVECMYDYETAISYVNAKKPTVRNEYPIAGTYDVNEEGDGDMYNKGMLFLNTLRHIINNDSLWFFMLKDMTTHEFAYKTITANDIMFYFKRMTKMDLTPVFMQYLYHAEIPQLYYSLQKDKKNNYTFTYKWQTNVSNFQMPVMLGVGENIVRLNGNDKLQEYNFAANKRDEVRILDSYLYFTRKQYK